MIVVKKMLFNPALEQERMFAHRHVCSKVRKAGLHMDKFSPKLSRQVYVLFFLVYKLASSRVNAVSNKFSFRKDIGCCYQFRGDCS